MAIEDSVSLIAIILFDNAIFFKSYLCDTNCTHQSHNITSNGQPTVGCPLHFKVIFLQSYLVLYRAHDECKTVILVRYHVFFHG